MITDQSNILRIVDGVIETHDGQRIMGSFPSTEEVNVSTTEENIFETLVFPIEAYESFEVMMVRVYYYQDMWHVSTRRKLDAFDSMWANDRSIGAQFERVVEERVGVNDGGLDVFLSSLDTNKKYFFLISLEDRQITGNFSNPRNGLWLAGFEENGEIRFDVNTLEKQAWDVLTKHVFETPQELKTFVLYNYNPHGLTGVMVCQPKGFLRLVHPDYYRRLTLRNNEPNIFRRALELMMAKNRDDLNEFVEQHSLNGFVRDVEKLVTFLHNMYMSRYVRKETIPKLQPAKYALLKRCHEHYIHYHARITRPVLKTILFQYFKPTMILKMLMAEETH